VCQWIARSGGILIQRKLVEEVCRIPKVSGSKLNHDRLFPKRMAVDPRIQRIDTLGGDVKSVRCWSE
jgi:hypothetical protein